MTSIRFILLGGFLGAGKTTTIARLARHYQSQGLKVGVVTNDQADDLVDSHSLRAQGFDVGEVAGACFCCKFNDLATTLDQLGDQLHPDVILAEPVGSCTDLVATVIRPLMAHSRRPLDIAPYGVLLKPSHGLRILRNQPNSGFSPQAAYIFRKQIEEADFVVINRIDQLAAVEVEELEQLLAAEFPGRPVLRISAKTGDGFASLVDFLGQHGRFGQRVMDVDYDTYAAGEAELGWLNAHVDVSSHKPIDVDPLLLDVVRRLERALAADHAETAHLKVIGMANGLYGVANLVSSFTDPELSLRSQAQEKEVQLVVNARVAISPERLEELVKKHVAAACDDIQVAAKFTQFVSFRPGRPVPTHRMN